MAVLAVRSVRCCAYATRRKRCLAQIRQGMRSMRLMRLR